VKFGIVIFLAAAAAFAEPLPKIRVAADGRTFVTETGKPFVPFGVNYYRPDTGWAPQIWKKFDADVTRKDFATMKSLGVNCVRIFLTFGSFFTETNALDTAGLAKFDQFLALAEEAGIYVHSTGPDHWEGVPEWARGDRFSDPKFLAAVRATLPGPQCDLRVRFAERARNSLESAEGRRCARVSAVARRHCR